MRPVRRLVPGLALALFVIATPARSQDGLDKYVMEAYGGTYMSDCSKTSAPRLTIFQDALVYIEGDKRIAGKNVMSASSFYGQSPPDGYRTMLLSDSDGGLQLMFAVYEDKLGLYIQLDGDPALVKRISPAMRTHKFRRCDGAGVKKAEVPAKVAPATPAAPTSGAGVGASGMLNDRKFKTIYVKALGPLAREEWLAALDGPSPETRKVTIAGVEYLLISCCKNHDCSDYNTVLLYSAPGKVVYGIVHRAGRTNLIGAPAPALAKELRRLWTAEWRSNP